MGREFLSVTNILTWWHHLPCVCQRKACSCGQQSYRSMGPDTCKYRSLSWKKIPNTGAWMKWGAKGRTSKGGGENHARFWGPSSRPGYPIYLTCSGPFVFILSVNSSWNYFQIIPKIFPWLISPPFSDIGSNRQAFLTISAKVVICFWLPPLSTL